MGHSLFVRREHNTLIYRQGQRDDRREPTPNRHWRMLKSGPRDHLIPTKGLSPPLTFSGAQRRTNLKSRCGCLGRAAVNRAAPIHDGRPPSGRSGQLGVSFSLPASSPVSGKWYSGKLLGLKGFLVPAERIELPTFGLQNRCSTAELSRLLNWGVVQDQFGPPFGRSNIRLACEGLEPGENSDRRVHEKGGPSGRLFAFRWVGLIPISACADFKPM
jgi:hypothetical protein